MVRIKSSLRLIFTVFIAKKPSQKLIQLNILHEEIYSVSRFGITVSAICRKLSVHNIKRHIIYDGKFDPVNLMEECGDLFWYLALYIHTTGRNGRLVDAVIADDVKVSKGKEILINTCLNLADLTSAFHTTQGSNDLKLICGTAGALKTLLVASGYTVEQALNRNIEKLAQRYGDRYTDYLALNRDTEAELVALKGEASV